MEIRIREIGLRWIAPNLRCVCDMESIDSLARDIRLNGQREPVQVWFAGECFRILDGEKRWRACRMLGLNSISAVIMEPAQSDDRAD